MKATKTDITGLRPNMVICSIWSKNSKSWTRTLENMDGVDVNVHKLVIERSLPGSGDKNWILAVYKNNVHEHNNRHVFNFDYSKYWCFKVWENI